MIDIDSIIEVVARKLSVGEDRRAFRKVVRRHLDDFDALRGKDLEWDQIAAKLTARGARHKRGQPIDAHQLRTEVARLRKDADKALVVIPRDDKISDPATVHRPTAQKSRSTAIASYAEGTEVGPGGRALERLAALTSTRVQAIEADE
jgi:hypothetical protein